MKKLIALALMLILIPVFCATGASAAAENGDPTEKYLKYQELLDALDQRNCPLALASSTRSATVTAQLRDAGLLPCFRAVIGGDQVSHSKPHPEIFLTAAEQLGVASGDCCVVEDSYNGIRAAHAGGMIPLMVPDTLPPDEEMHRLAWAIVPDLFALRDLLCG